jgi:putative membrane protein
MMRIAFLMAASLLATTACGNPAEQDQRVGADTGAMSGETAAGMAEPAPTAQEFAQKVAMSDMYEIAAGNVALKRAAGTPTKEFAQMMVTDHSQSSEALKDAVAASGQSLAMPGKLDAEHQAQVDILESLEGPDFDREYMSQQMAAHRKALALLKSYGGNGDVAELRQFAQSAIPTVQKHHDWLDQNSPSPSATGGTPGTTMGATPAP